MKTINRILKESLFISGCFFICLLGSSSTSTAQIINTVAGNGIAGFTGDGGSATAAQLSLPRGVHVDAAGNIYIADHSNNRIRKISTSGIISTVAGGGSTLGDGGAATAAQLVYPIAMITDASGNLYIADANQDRIRKVNSSGIISTIAGTGIGGYSGDGFAATVSNLSNPFDLARDGSGNLYIVDELNCRIRKVDPSGIMTTIAGNGSVGFTGDGGPATATRLNYPYGVAVDGAGNVYIADRGNSRIRKVNTMGIITTIAGTGVAGYSGDGGSATMAQLNYPTRICLDAAGNMFISDAGNYRVRKIDPSGTIITIAGLGTPGFTGDGCAASSASVVDLWGITADGVGNIYMADGNNNRVRKISNGHTPAFTGGHYQSKVVCAHDLSISVDSLLAITDADINQSETWTVITPPAHGTLFSSYTATSTGGILIPSGLIYTLTSGYTGYDTIKVRVTDCMAISDTTTVYFTIADCTLDISSVQGNETINIYPNPALDELIINTDKNAYTSFKITNTIGQQFLQHQLHTTQTKVDVSTLPMGLYYVTFSWEEGSIVKKFVKQ